ncbi:hypothetical protein CN204_20190 [Sinorhizobium meliloti]|uniref:Uncharacterized protein n=1 Tax=Sinorhizobium meliloti (strain SM11) TaxID=707241 RepID=A4KVL3_SINMM|nr:hypothetical protein [Sinorhizobium meliloti]ABN47114.1 hypothetical protein [Sinorhizobium meliloti SM11]ARS66233.1 hypothetical protein SMRU11_02220 [Sinorhizobium meliloti RU11/001]MDE3765490.1 hypothetical protein [Sinorhizobium meliloti]MDE3779270.1 hypothetical protein [Sinorhizobium meliloti]MDE3804773.1 hypothetical protein [Sinorhizobium meliloti]
MNQANQGEPSKSVSTDQETSTEPLHRELQLMHERYFRDVADACADSQSRYLSVQTEFERGLEKAYQSQQPELFRAAQDDYQQKMQSLYSDPTLPQQYADAYDRYKVALKRLISETDMSDLGFMDIRNLGQSLLSVSTTAMNLPPRGATTVAAANNPFTPPGGAA